MEERSFYRGVLLAIVAIVAGGITANAQTTPSPTPTPSESCSIATLPDGSPAICLTGAEPPPSLLGVSGGNYNSVSFAHGAVSCCSGTLGALVLNANNVPMVLGSNHVLARTSGGVRFATAGERILQPSLQDLGCWQDGTDAVARLTRWVPIRFGPGIKNEVDAAVAKVITTNVTPGGPAVSGVDPSGTILNIGQISTTPFPHKNLIDGLPVMKMGRSSCLTVGVVDAFDAMGKVVYDNTCNNATSGTAMFDHQILVFGQVPGTSQTCSFASTGDSGALVVTNNFTCPQPVGLVFAGASGAAADSGGQIVAVNPIQTVLGDLGVTLVGKACTPVSPVGQQINDAMGMPVMTDALRASIEHVRSLKAAHAPKLLAQDNVVAVGIGAGDNPDTAALKIYVTDDNPQVRGAVAAEIGGEPVTYRVLAGKLGSL
jgi:hypothetical protein